ncbi:MAG: nucleotidyl transferase AbiEii/AbiGii toxin family protein [Oscillospiraceae bacterium]|nr:nucleotidyl transferase AbiEii/AbiGii toxin family protein [Oscillospiraceae bacterium]
MISSSRQLKDKIRNLAKDKSANAQILLRSYMMERFLERVAVSNYSNKFILKGGMLITSMVGFEARSTMDIDATMSGITVNTDEIQKIIEEITSIDLSDGVIFAVTSVSDIMDDAEYPGIRVGMTAYMDNIKAPLKVDISTGDIITPAAIQYSYKLMFEERTICLLAYNLETVLAEKLESIIARTTANSRMRDFYDIHILSIERWGKIDKATLTEALRATSSKRGSLKLLDEAEKVLTDLHDDKMMYSLWENYRSHFNYAADISWYTVLRSARYLAISAGLQVKQPSVLERLQEPLPEKTAIEILRENDVKDMER